MEGELVAAVIGLAIALVGVGIAARGFPLIVALNRLYAAIPGRFQYPVWWHRFVGGIFVAIGLLIAVVGLATVKG